MRGWLAACVLAAGCSFQPGPAITTSDGPISVPGDAKNCFGTTNLCLVTTPNGTLMLPSINPLDTGIAANCSAVLPQADGPSVCVIAATKLIVGSMAAIG